MKRFIAICLSFILVLCTIPASVFAVQTASFTLEGLNGDKANAGDTITARIIVPAIEKEFATFALGVEFNKDVLEVESLNLPDKIGGSKTIATDVNEANQEGYYGIVAGEVDNFKMTASISLVATFKVKTSAKAGECKEVIKIVDQGDSEYSVTDAEGNDIEKPEFSIQSYDITIIKPITSELSLSGSLTTPTKGGTDSSKLTGDNVKAEISWNPALVDNKFAAGTEYTATITVKPDQYYSFGEGASIDFDGLTFKKSGENFVATKTFQKTATKSVTGLEITAQPTKKTYTHGDSFDAAGMVVKAVYDDGSEDADFKAYEVVYANEGKSYLKYNDTKVTLKVGDVAAEVTRLEVNKKELEITGLKAVDREYDGTTKVSLTGGTLVGAVAGEAVTAAIPKEGSVADGSVGTKDVIVTTPNLTGADADCYTLKEITGIKVEITAADIPDAVVDAIKGYNGEYDAQSHDAVIIGEDANGYTVKFAEAKDGDYSSDVPRIINVADSKTVWVKISKANYADRIISVNANVNPKNLTAADLEYTGADVTKEYDGNTACDVKSVKTKTASVFGQDITVTGKAVYDKKGTDATKVIFTADGITEGNYRLASGTVLEIDASITATDQYSADDKFNTQNVVKGIGEFEEPQFVSEFNETVKGTFDFTYNGEAKTKEQIVAELKDKDAGEKASIEYTFTPTDSNYTGTKTGTISITMIDIEFMAGDETATVDNAVTVKNDAPVYGTKWSDIIALKNNINAKVGDRAVAGTYTLSIDTDTIPAAGTAVYNVLFTSTDGQYNNVKVFATDASVQVSQKPLTVAGAKAEDRQFDGTTSIAVTGGTLNGVVGEDDVTLGEAPEGTIENADAGNKKAVTVTGYEISGADAGNYTLVQPTDVTVNILKKELTLKNVTVADKRFDGTTKATVTKVEFEQTSPLPAVSGYTATAEFADAKAGTDKASVKVVLNDKNYSLAENTITIDANITKAAAVTIPEQEIIVKVGDKNKYTVDFSDVMPENAGNVTAKDVTLSKNDDNILYEIDNKEAYVEFYVNPDEATAARKTGKLMLTLTSDNYEDSQAVIVVKTTNDNIPAVNVEEIKAEYTGQPVSIKATSDIKGIFAWKTGNAPVNVADSGIYEVVFTPDDNAYETVTKTIRVTITPAKVSGNLEFDKVNTSGKTLGEITPADFTKLNVEGTFTWNDGDAQVIEQGKAYGWTFTPNDENYAVLRGTVTPWAASGGGGGGGILPPPQVVEKPEITVDNAQGKVELSADGTTATITPNDGYEIDKVTVNGKEVTAVDNKVTGLKTGDKVVVTFKEKAAPEPEFDVQKYVSELKIVARSSKTAKKNIRVKVASVTDQNGTAVDLADLKAKGYTVKYKFYRSDKKASKYTAKVEKNIDTNSYVNTTGKNGAKYFYKVRIMIYDNDGKLVAKSALKQCKYASRTWTKK